MIALIALAVKPTFICLQYIFFLRNYALEALCKLSVIEHNVDLLLSTGPWSRLESFIKMLVGLLALNEEIPSRLVI